MVWEIRDSGVQGGIREFGSRATPLQGNMMERYLGQTKSVKEKLLKNVSVLIIY